MLNALELHKYLKASADKGQLKIRYEDTKMPRTDGNTVFLPRVDLFTTEAEAKHLMHYVNHEASHVRFSDFKIMGEEGIDAGNSALGAMWNIFEDHRMDYLNGTEFEGDRQTGDSTYEEAAHGALESMSNFAKQGPEQQQLADRIRSVLAFDSKVKSDLYANCASVYEEAKKGLSKEGLDWLKKMEQGDYGERLQNIRNDTTTKGSRKTLELSERIWEEVFNEDAEEEKKRAKEQDKNSGKNGKGDDEGEGGGQGESEENGTEAGSGDEEDGDEAGQGDVDPNKLYEMKEGDPNKKKTKSLKKQIMNVKYNDMLPSSHSFKSGPEGDYTPNNTGQHVDYSEYKSKGREFKQCSYFEYNVKDYTKGRGQGKFSGWSGTLTAGHYGHMMKGTLDNVHFDGFANKVRMKLQIRSKGRTLYGVKKGKIHKPLIHRVCMTDAHGLNERLFKHQVKSNVLDTCVQIICDASGSMAGDKFCHAACASALLSNTIGNILHIPVEVLAFSENRGVGSDMFVLRNFDDKLVSNATLVDRFSDVTGYMSGNADGEAVMFGYNRIAKRKEKRKLIIVLSDGSPACSRPGIVDYTAKVVKNIENSKRVDIVGIGIQDTNVTRFYKQNQVLHKIEDLEPCLLNLIDRKLV